MLTSLRPVDAGQRPAGDDVAAIMADIGRRARAAARTLALAPAETKNAALTAMAAAVRADRAAILAVNRRDVAAMREAGQAGSFIDRSTLEDGRVEAIARSLEEVAALPDPVGAVIAAWERPNGLAIERVRTPLGVVGVIYESRPNVTADAGALCLKAGNAVVLRGGSDALATSLAIHACLARGLEAAGLPADAIQFVPTHRPCRRRRDAGGARRQHRRHRAARRQEPRRPRPGGGARAGVRPPRRPRSRLCRTRRPTSRW
jgi:glutamate-5-semialdehyde dehydrogenase